MRKTRIKDRRKRKKWIIFLLLISLIIIESTVLLSLNGRLNNLKVEQGLLEENYTSCMGEVSHLENVVNNKENIINIKKDRINVLLERLVKLESKKAELQKEKRKLEEKLDRKTIFYTPTLEEVRKIVEESNIDENEFEYGKYICSEYSYDLISVLLKNGIFSCTTELTIDDEYGHALVSVETTEGRVYIEPQDDTIFRDMSKGDDYCDIVNWNCAEKWEIEKISTC